MTIDEAIGTLEGLYAQLYDSITGRKKALSAKRYNAIYESYEELEKEYEYGLGEEERPEYGQDDLNDFLDDVCAALL